jgi:intein/homing endonuclease
MEAAGDSPEAEFVIDEVKPFRPKIFNILDYIESSWGLAMRLYPVQRFLVKLYYFIPLDNTEKTIEIKDMLGTKIQYRFTEQEYLKFLFNEGRCNIAEVDRERRQLILSIGRRGGKCVSDVILMPTSRGLMRITELGDTRGPEYQILNDVTVAQEAGRSARAAYFYVGGQQDTVQLVTRLGLRLEGTKNHRIKVLGSDGTIQWRRMDSLQLGDRICVHRGADLWASREQITPECSSVRRRFISFPDTVNEDLGCLLGVLVGDGTWPNLGGLEITVGPYPEWLEKLVELICRTLGEAPKVRRDVARATRVQVHSKALRQLLHQLGFRTDAKSATKSIPTAILRSPKPVVSAFLRGLFETDGGVESGRKVSFCSASKQLAEEVQCILLNYGIVSRVKTRRNKKYDRDYYHLYLIGAESIKIFHREIGFLSDRKKALLQAHIDKGALGNKSGTESIPYQQMWARQLNESVESRGCHYAGGGRVATVSLGGGFHRMQVRAALGNVLKPSCNEDLSYPRLRQVLKVCDDLAVTGAAVDHFRYLASANYYFDEVTSLGEGRAEVYDLNVPDGESFVANGFTNHNTTLSSIFASYEIYRLLNLRNPQQYYGFPNGNLIQIISVATDKDQAGILFNEVTTHLAKCEYFKPFIANNTQSQIKFRTPYDIDRFGPTSRHQNGKFVSFNGKATLRVTFKSCIAKGLRGHSNAVVIMDEMAHYQDAGQSSAKDIYDSVTPSTATYSPKDPRTGMTMKQPDGSEYPVESRIIAISSPLNRSGKFYDLYHLAMTSGPGSENMLAIQAPTWEINPTVSADYYKQKYHEDPAVFLTEHGAQFSSRVRGWIEREEDLLACIDDSHRPMMIGTPRYPHQMGIDIGLINDGTAIFITTEVGGRIVLVYHELWQAGTDWKKSNPHLGSNYSTDYCKTLSEQPRLEFDEISDWVYKLSKRFHITEGIFDQFVGTPLEQALIKKGLSQFRCERFSPDYTSRIYQNAKMMMFDRALLLYDFPKYNMGEVSGNKHSPFIQELLTLEARIKTKNIIEVQAPQSGGYHDDMSDAFARAVWLTSERMRNQKTVFGSLPGMRNADGDSMMTARRYQMMRARTHGLFGDRDPTARYRAVRPRTPRGVR